ncbi:TOMM precursor leader peptide-binding protein [Nonomuraea sediminis]|uniref:TOMM precursor leader peptide-binding protein n=1 Tax=Nonomuraea sediminis TaxID=2835864 RepID=UPI001BDBB63C|nr:TOMM precursor leader peptide-binding protein [Nonomuraea sediminis]
MDIWISPSGDFGHSFAEQLRALLAGTGRTVRVAGEPGPGFAVRAAWRDVPAEFEAFAATARTPWLAVAQAHPYLRVGPAVVPGIAPCHECYLTRVRQHGPADGVEAALAAHPEVGVGGFAPHQVMMAAGMALALIDTAEAGTLVTIDCRTDEVVSWRVVPAHACRGCGT